LVGGIAGCTAESDESPESEQPDVTTVSVSAEDYQAENAVNTITFRYATATRRTINPPGTIEYTPDSGNKFVLFHAEATVETEREQLDVYGSVIALRADGIIHSGNAIVDVPDFSQTVVSGATFDGWARFEVPTDVTEATLTATDVGLYFNYPTAIDFEADESVSVSLPE